MSFVILGVTLTGLLSAFLVRAGSAARVVAGITCSVLLAFEVHLLAAPPMLGAGAWYARSPYWEACLFAVMVVGMACRYMTVAIEERRRRLEATRASGSPRRIRLQFDPWEFTYPLFVSVITFGGVLAAIETQGLNLANTIVSFQTGFFWQTVLAARATSRSAVAGDVQLVAEKSP